MGLLGALRVTRDGREIPLPASRKARSLLAYLVVERRPIRRSRLCEMFWDVPNDPRGELRWCLSKLRGVLDEEGHKRIRADRDFVAADTTTIVVDLHAVEQAIDGILAGDDVLALETLATTLGEGFLQGLDAGRTPLFEAWLLAKRQQCRAWHGCVLQRLALLHGGDRRSAVLRDRVAIRPDGLGSRRDLLTALLPAERASEDEAHLRVASRLLESHGIDPSSHVRGWPAMRHASSARPLPSMSLGLGDVRAWAGVAGAVRPTRRPPAAGTADGLPPPLTSYVGRCGEERDIRTLIARHRSVSLVGAGGAGKTRLAIELGRRLVAEMPGGVWFVGLESLSDPEMVGEALCGSLGVPLPDGCSAAVSAAAYLRDRRALVILDNCEHLVDAVARVVVELMVACPDLSILSTSRERLDVPGEGLYLLSGLGLPPAGPLSAAIAREHDACRLFEERAKAFIGDFALSDANVGAVCDICRRLEGIPLAIELVAPQLRMAPLQHLADRLQEHMLATPGVKRGAAPRHRTLLALFDWSYNLLDPVEQQLLRRLSAFNGGWSLAAATALVDREMGDVFDDLSRLVDKSLVVADLHGATPRYRLLRTIHQCVLIKCAEVGEAPPRERLAATMLALLREADDTWPTTPTEIWLTRYQPDLDNVRASLDWAFGEMGDRGLGTGLCAYSRRIWDDLALLSERERWFATAIENADPSTSAPVMARLWLGRMSNSSHGDRTNFAPARNAADLFERCGDDRGRGEALAGAGAALQTPATTREALSFLQEALHILAPLGPSKPLAHCLRSLAIARYFERDFGRARPLLARSEAVARAVGDLRGIAAVQLAAAELSFAAGDADTAVHEIDEMLGGRHGSRRQMVLGLTNLAAYLLALDRVVEAEAAALRALDEARALDWQAALIRAIEHLALVAALAGKHEVAAAMLGRCVAFYDTGKASRELTEIASYERLKALVTAALEPSALEDAMAQGALWTVDEAIRCARTAP